MMHVLVTGSSGYIGSGLCNYLENQNIKVSKCDIGWFGQQVGQNFIKESITDFDFIIHLAGHSSVALCESDKQGAWKNNVSYFKSLVDSLNPSQTLIYASSGSVYGNSEGIASEESATLQSLMTYDMTKIIKDVIALNALNFNKKIVGLRFGTVNGLTPNTRIDLMMNSMVWNSINNNKIFVKNSKISRPILFTQDLYAAVIAILNKPESGVFNLASENLTVEQVANLVQELTKSPIVRMTDDQKPYNFALDCGKFRNTFGNYKKVSTELVLEELIEEISDVEVGRRDMLSPEQVCSL